MLIQARPIACILLAALLYASVATNLLVNHGSFSDDNLYLYTSNFAFSKHQEWAESSQDIIRYLEEQNYSPERIARFQFRYDYNGNYFLYTAFITLVRGLGWGALADMDYGAWLYIILQTGLGLGHALCLAIVIVALWRARDTVLPAAVLVMIVGMVAVMPIIREPNWMLVRHLVSQEPSIWGFFGQLLGFVINPGHQFDMFGSTPRNGVTFLLVAITVFRLSKSISQGYWAILLGTLMHGTYGFLILVVYIMVDALLEPERLRARSILLPVTLTVVVAFFNILNFDSVGGVGIGFVLFALVVLAIVGMLLPAGERLLGRFWPVAKLRKMDQTQAETVLILAGILSAIVLSLILVQVSSGLATAYVAREMSGRPVALLRVPLFLGATALLSQWRVPYLKPALTYIAMLTALVLSIQTLNKIPPFQKRWKTAPEMELAIEKSLGNTDTPIREANFYFAFSSQLDGQSRLLDHLLSAPEEP